MFRNEQSVFECELHIIFTADLKKAAEHQLRWSGDDEKKCRWKEHKVKLDGIEP